MSSAAPPSFALSGYETLLTLERGGMGEVVLARRRGAHGFERLVAIKKIRTDLRSRDQFRAMFLDEARLMARLHHPNIAQVYDFGEEEGALYLVMEYVAGPDFDELMDRSPPPVIAARAIAEACRGLHAAHELTDDSGKPLEVVHRDVSPPNLILTFDGRVKILDFGIAWMKGRGAPETEYGTIKGKPPYMSPEQLRGGRLDRRADIWAAANVLYELLTRERLFSGTSAYQVAHAIEHAEIRPPSERAGPLPEGLDEVVLRGLARGPEQRFQSAYAMANALDRVVARAGGESLEEYVERELREAREAHRAQIAQALSALEEGPDEAPAGRPSAVMTVQDEAAVLPDPGEEPDVESPVLRPDPSPRGRSVRAVLAVTLTAALGVAAFALWSGSSGPRPLEVARKGAPDAEPAGGGADAGGRTSDAGGRTPDAGRRTPDAGRRTPDAGRRRPEAGRRRPEAGRRRPEAGRRRARAQERRADAAPPRATPEPAAFGFLTFAAEPFALVKLDGESLGPTPIFRHRVRAGTHEVVLVSPDTGEVRLRRQVRVQKGRTEQVILR